MSPSFFGSLTNVSKIQEGVLWDMFNTCQECVKPLKAQTQKKDSKAKKEKKQQIEDL